MKPHSRSALHRIVGLAAALVLSAGVGAEPADPVGPGEPTAGHHETADDPYLPTPPQPAIAPCTVPVIRCPFVSVQVNVDASGNNIVGDAANEPSIAIDPTDPSRIVIGWRQFDSIESSFRQAGWAYSHDAGQTWTFPGALEPEVFRSDPVLGSDAKGNVYYYSLGIDFQCHLFKSTDGGVSWLAPVNAPGWDKPWMTIDRTSGIGSGNIYCGASNVGRSTDGGLTFPQEVFVGGYWGTMTVDPNGVVYKVGRPSWDGAPVWKSTNAQDPIAYPVFESLTNADMGGAYRNEGGPNPGGLAGQPWIACDHSVGPQKGNVYLFGSVWPDESDDPLDVMFTRSGDGGMTWSEPIRVNDDLPDNGAWQWFGTMSVAPNGRIDVVWNDTRNTGAVNLSEFYYACSRDAGVTWSPNVVVSPAFDSHLGWPQQAKLGDYYDMISDNDGASVAYAATFNGEQDVYFLRIPRDCNGNGVDDLDDVGNGKSDDCNANGVPDECECDFDGDGLIDGCDPDTDGDGVPDDIDICDYTPLGSRIKADGSQLGDVDLDCDLDLDDFAFFGECIASSGPGQPSPDPPCMHFADYEPDLDIDLNDFAIMQRER